jgi:hypothetical protein
MYKLYACRLYVQVACKQVVCRQQNSDTTEDSLLIHCGQQKYIYNLSNYFSTADSRNTFKLLLFHSGQQKQIYFTAITPTSHFGE